MNANNRKDVEELAKFGYDQQLVRSMGGFSSFAISFSLISVITGVFANFSFGVQQVGGAIVWSWLLVAAGQFLVALVMADLSTRFPISGYGYQWTSRLTNPHLGYFVGWALLMQFITGFPGVCQALAVTVHSMAGSVGGDWGITWITVGIITLITLIHLYGIRLVALVNDIGVWAELAGVLFIICLLWGLWLWAGTFDFSNLLDSKNAATGTASGLSGFALSLLVGAWCLTGFEAAADLAEETHQPKKVVPRAVITSQVAASITGFFMIGGFIISVSDISLLQQSDNPIMLVLDNVLGSIGSNIFGVVIVLSILACGVACMATATRLIYSLARDNMLPYSNILGKVDKKYSAPRKATIFVWAIGCVFVIALRHLELITSISAVAGYLGYFGIMLATLISKKQSEESDGFSLGKFRTLVRVIALVWSAIVVAGLTIPATEVAGMDETHLPIKSAVVAIAVGLVFYIVKIRKRIIDGSAGPPKVN